MTREDIIRMARMVRDGGHWNQLDLILFATLVAAAARAEENEACAKVCEEMDWCYDDRQDFAAAIRRARGNI